MLTPIGTSETLPCQPHRQLAGAVVVEPHPVEQRPVVGQPEHPRRRIAGLRLRGDRADLGVSETQRTPGVQAARHPCRSRRPGPSGPGNAPRTPCWPAPDPCGASRRARRRRSTGGRGGGAQHRRTPRCGCVRAAPGTTPAAARGTSRRITAPAGPGRAACRRVFLRRNSTRRAAVGVQPHPGQLPTRGTRPRSTTGWRR